VPTTFVLPLLQQVLSRLNDVGRITEAEGIRTASTLDELGASICVALRECVAATTVVWHMRPHGQRHWQVLPAGQTPPFGAQLMMPGEYGVHVPVQTSGDLEVKLLPWHESRPFTEAQQALTEAIGSPMVGRRGSDIVLSTPPA
jgi:hypothetical protein